MRNYRLFLSVLFLCLLIPGFLSALPQSDQKPASAGEPSTLMKARVFQLNHRTPRVLVQVLLPLTSGKSGSVMQGSEEMRTISVRDYPENLEAIEAAIRLLDKPESATARSALEVQISLIAASREPIEGDSQIPATVAPVVEQLRRTLSFTHYRYITTLSQRTLDQGRLGASGIIPNMFPVRQLQNKPGQYEYNLKDLRVIPGTSGAATIQAGEFEFIASLPVVANPRQVEVGVAEPKWEYQRLSMATGLTLREGEQVVVGTSNIGNGDKAIIVVVSMRRVPEERIAGK
jgi:hypothetical protein